MFHDYAVGSIFENLFYLTYKWTCVCPLSQITPLRWLLTYTSHKHATLSIYMLLETYLDMYMSIQPNHTIDMTVNIHIQQTCCQSTIQHSYWITHTTLRHRVAGKHPFCVLIYMNSYIFYICFILFILLSYLIFDFVCLTLSSADTHGIAK